MNNQSLEVVSEVVPKCANWNQEESPLLMGEIEAFIDVKHRNGNARMLIVSDCSSPTFVSVSITESLNTSLKMQDAEVGDYIIIDSGVEAQSAEHFQITNLVLINKVGADGLRDFDYQSFKSSYENNRLGLNNETDYAPKPLLIEPLEDSTDK